MHSHKANIKRDCTILIFPQCIAEIPRYPLPRRSLIVTRAHQIHPTFSMVHTHRAQESYLHSLNLCSAVLSTEAEATETEVMLTDYPPDFPRILEKTS